MQSSTPNSEITAAARSSLSGNWGKAIGAMFLYGFIMIGLTLGDSVLCSFFMPTESSFGLAQWIFSGAMMVGLAAFFISLTDGIPELSRLFDGFNRFGRSFCALFAYGFLLFAWALLPIIPLIIALFLCNYLLIIWTFLLIIPCIIKTYSYAMTFFILADDPAIGTREAITRSREIMDGNKFKFWLLSWRFLGWSILCSFTGGIGFLWLIPYMQTSFAEFYKDIK